ncbi:TonB-dependent receptor [uncultured Sunxiuqinia sp.]|uniref:TonB-dependent receptor n=1 Tax=uncultured Sunxiuqinia sp. TaxID=1573825 RepID=UPI002AA673D0|nr:TonB-dependent receptor [uncultured Sunxiuqinia sp.]
MKKKQNLRLMHDIGLLKMIKMMRFTIFILFISLSQAFAVNSYSQQAKLTLYMKDVKVEDVIDEIENNSEFFFLYNKSMVDVDRKVNINVVGESVNEILDRLFNDTDISYSIKNRQILLINSQLEEKTYQQSQSVSGKVTDQSGFPLPGVTVILKGTSSGTITRPDGTYVLNDIPNDATLVFSFIGMASQSQKIQGRSVINVTMAEDLIGVDEVVVIGYGTRQKKNLVGAVDQVNSDIIEGRPVSNASQALQGASANLIIQQKSMNPNDNNMSINIRGVSTMSNNDPLIVIDGLISGTGTLNNLNPNDIENISVLKDAGSAAIYGSRSANGVILVTTRKGGKTGKPQVKFSSMVGYQDPDILFQPVQGWENAMLRDQANMNVGNAPIFTPEQIRDLYEHRGEEYWYLNEIMSKGLQQNYNMSVSGGNENSTYMISAGYFDQESNFAGDFGMKRHNFRSNHTTEYGRFKLTSLMAYTKRIENTVAGGTGNTIINSSRIPPYYYYKFQQDGKWLINDVIGDDNTMGGLLDGGYEKKDEDNFIGSLGLDFSIIDGLKAKGLVGLDLTQHHRFRRDLKVPLYSSADLETPVSYINSNTLTEDYNSKRYTLSTQFMLDFDRTFNSVHHVSGLVGVSNESYTFKASRIAWEYTDEDLGLPTTDESVQNTDNKNSNGDTDQTSITSVFGRLGYNYMDKYYADVTVRYDGSSKFAEDQRWGLFPSVSAAWRLSSENFMKSYSDRIGDLKIRTSYGVLGNQNVDNYSYQTVYQMYQNTYVFNNKSVPGTGYTFGNPFLTWEKSANLNIGLDAGFFNGSLYVTLDYFNKETTDILLSPEVSTVFGSNAAKENAGKMRNRGWEATLTYRLKSTNFDHRFNLNIADSKNEVTDFGGEESIEPNDQLYKLIRESEALGSYFGFKTDGYFQSYEEIANSVLPVGASVQPGDVKYKDINGDEVIDNKDRVVLGNAFPRYTFGFTYDVSFKNFDFSVLLQGVGKRDMYIRGELIEPFHSNYSYVIYQHQLDFWTPTNPDAKWPRLVAPSSSSSANNWGKAGTDIYLLNGAYLRVKNIQLGYTVPKRLTSRVGIQKLRASLNAQNLLTLSKNSFIDPESSEFGNNMGGIGGVGANSARNYPTLIYYGFGLELEF